jgi:dTDP-4-amino-4,6-dideoxygalactose transaminase
VRLDERFFEEDRDEIVAGLIRHDILASGGWPVAPMLPEVYQPETDPDQWPIANRFAARTIRLPCHSRLSNREVDLICQTLDLMMTQSVFTRE